MCQPSAVILTSSWPFCALRGPQGLSDYLSKPNRYQRCRELIKSKNETQVRLSAGNPELKIRSGDFRTKNSSVISSAVLAISWTLPTPTFCPRRRQSRSRNEKMNANIRERIAKSRFSTRRWRQSGGIWPSQRAPAGQGKAEGSIAVDPPSSSE
jgi:hypothetical protein